MNYNTINLNYNTSFKLRCTLRIQSLENFEILIIKKTKLAPFQLTKEACHRVPLNRVPIMHLVELTQVTKTSGQYEYCDWIVSYIMFVSEYCDWIV